MKKNILLLPAIVMLSLIFLGSCRQERNRSITMPYIEASNTASLAITQVDLTDSNTVIHFRAYQRPGYWIRISPSSQIIADGTAYPMISADSIVPGEEFWMTESGEKDFTLTFDALPAGTESFDFNEGDVEDGWTLWGVDVTGKAADEKYHADLPKSLRHEPADGPMPEPIFKTGTTKINLHRLGHRKGMPDKVTAYVMTLHGTQDEMTVRLDSLGNGTLEFPQYGTSRIFLIDQDTYSNYGSFYSAPGETIDVYVNAPYQSPRENVDKKHSRIYTTGTYSDLNSMLSEGYPNYSIEFHDNSMPYNVDTDGYMNHFMSSYKALSDSIESSDMPQMLKEFKLADLRAQLMSTMSDYRSVLANIYFKEHQDTRRMPVDSINVDLQPEHYKMIGGLFDTGNPKLLMLFRPYIYSVNWTDYGSSSNLPAEISSYIAASEKANKCTLTDADIEELKKLDNKFFAEACADMQTNALKRQEELSKMIQTTPEVADDKVFDAIVAPHKGKVVLVDLWNTWCGPCRAAISHNEPVKATELSDDDIVWIYIADESSPIGTYARMIPDIKGLHYRVNEDQIRSIRERFNVDGIPFYIMVDRSGKVEAHPDFRDHNLMKSSLLNALK